MWYYWIYISSTKDFITKQMINLLKKLEYRGYDSSGICLLCDDQLKVFKSLGEIKNLEQVANNNILSHMAIAHTRWATYGKVCFENIYPHT